MIKKTLTKWSIVRDKFSPRSRLQGIDEDLNCEVTTSIVVELDEENYPPQSAITLSGSYYILKDLHPSYEKFLNEKRKSKTS